VLAAFEFETERRDLTRRLSEEADCICLPVHARSIRVPVTAALSVVGSDRSSGPEHRWSPFLVYRGPGAGCTVFGVRERAHQPQMVRHRVNAAPDPGGRSSLPRKGVVLINDRLATCIALLIVSTHPDIACGGPDVRPPSLRQVSMFAVRVERPSPIA
jgi:hypothetical protein